jgi:hypothetical protein
MVSPKPDIDQSAAATGNVAAMEAQVGGAAPAAAAGATEGKAGAAGKASTGEATKGGKVGGGVGIGK